MNVIAVRQIKSMTATFSSYDVFVYRIAEGIEELHGNCESVLFDIPVSDLAIKDGQIEAWLEPDETFYGRFTTDGSGKWADTDEYKSHCAQYLADGWYVYCPIMEREAKADQK